MDVCVGSHVYVCELTLVGQSWMLSEARHMYLCVP